MVQRHVRWFYSVYRNLEQFNHNLQNYVLMTSYPNHQYRKMHLRKFDFLFVGHAESKYIVSVSALISLLLSRQEMAIRFKQSISLTFGNGDLSEVLKISGKQVKPWHQMNTHMRNSSIIFKNSCLHSISHHPKRCQYLIV